MKMNRSIVRWLLLAVVVTSLSAASFGQIAVGISVRIGPPALPVYAQPMVPGPGYMWTPGYWAWNDDGGYYWVPGTWVMAPVGMYWTPGYWGWSGGLYMWNAGYWGPHIGFYGGINYGFGYGGVGFAGGEWRGGGLYYNRSVTNVSVTNVTNVYNKTVIVNNTTVNNVSYNGGTGGVTARPTPQEQAATNEPHTAPLAAQTQHETLAGQNRQNWASVNQGRPAIAATARPGDFSSHSVIPARAAGGEYHAPAMSPAEARGPSTPMNSHSNQGFRPFTPPNSNNPQNKTATGTPASTPAHNAPQANTSKPAPPAPKKSSPPPPPQHKQSEPKEHGKF
ncbi:putative membrane protein [Candidatus Sulfotelmatobacter kueseliae]|uniref:Putative membrane protein n=1 Tax=Candidatus Sulfotelmatobacter kueseliae TaxID=2042962 RepID=A0A2U3L4C2_9BACT|nr:putative membrane protein [Candidatus Sulfotelmatobacter kueseliae]